MAATQHFSTEQVDEEEITPDYEMVDDAIKGIEAKELITQAKGCKDSQVILEALMAVLPPSSSSRSKALKSTREALLKMGDCGYFGRMELLRVRERDFPHRFLEHKPRQGTSAMATAKIARQFYLLELYWLYWKNH